jgi:predicted transcriptional regulator
MAGITKQQWEEAVDGSGMDTVNTYSFITEEDVTKQITLAGPNVLGAMCAYCGAGPQ